MPKIKAPLTDTYIKNLKAADKGRKESDGGGLYIYISPTGGKFWYLVYRFGGKQKTLSLGEYPANLASVLSVPLIYLKAGFTFRPARKKT